MVASTHTCVTCNHSHMHIGMHSHTYLLTHSCINTPAHTLTHDTNAHTHTQIHACVHPYHTHISTDTHTHTHTKNIQSHAQNSLCLLPLLTSSYNAHTHTHTYSYVHTATQMHAHLHTQVHPDLHTHIHTHILDCQGTTHISQVQSAIVKTAQPLIKSSFFILHMNWPTSTSLPHSTQ